MNEAIRIRGEAIIKHEYLLLKERTKQLIVKEYMESELKTLHLEKLDILTEREKYLRVNEIER